MVTVARVRPGTIADELGIKPGTELLAVNGREVDDFLDWEFLTADDELLVHARLPGGEEFEFDIERPEGESLGVELVPPSVRRCANRCEFCFIEGLPKGLRRNLYIRDDDYRLSFAYGNFATLSNLKERDERRIIEYRLSPLYVSVHATPWEARKVLLNNPRVPNIVEQLTRLATHGIQFHCQMVIVPGLNDGDVLAFHPRFDNELVVGREEFPVQEISERAPIDRHQLGARGNTDFFSDAARCNTCDSNHSLPPRTRQPKRDAPDKSKRIGLKRLTYFSTSRSRNQFELTTSVLTLNDGSRSLTIAGVTRTSAEHSRVRRSFLRSSC